MLPPNLVVDVVSDLCPGLLFLHYAPGWPPTPRLQQQVVLHQVGWWDCPSLLHLVNNLLLSLLAAVAPLEWPEFLRLSTSDFRFLSYPWRFLMAVCSAMFSASLAERRLAYIANC